MVFVLTLVGRAFAIDMDGDGWQPPADCNDRSAAIHPITAEIAGDGRDQNCDGAETCFLDSDRDGARDPALLFGAYVLVASVDTDCTDPGEALATADDCAPTYAGISPLETERVGNGIDDDCDGSEACYWDGDDDGFGAGAMAPSADLDCDDVAEAVVLGDCDDAEPLVHPGADEFAGDSMDQDCDGVELCYVDSDGDGARSELRIESDDLECLDAWEAWSWAPLDCDDGDPGRTPGAIEMCDGVDNDCDGAVDPIDLLGATPGVPGAINTWEVIGGPPFSTARLVTSRTLGESTLIGCPSDPYDLANARRIGSGATNVNGDASLSGSVAASAAGHTVYAQVSFPGTCELSCVVETAF